MDLEEANTSLNHQRAAQAKASKLESESSKIESDAQISTLTAKVNSLETKLRSSKEREKELKEELETALNDTKTSGSVRYSGVISDCRTRKRETCKKHFGKPKLLPNRSQKKSLTCKRN